MDIERLVMEHKKEKDRNVADRILLIILIQRDNMFTKAARHLNRSRSWGVKWNHRYQESGIACRTNPDQAGHQRLQGHHEKDTKTDSKDCLLGGRICTEFHK